MTILHGEFGHINHIRIILTNALNTLLVPGNPPALRLAPGQIKPGNLLKKEELTLLESGSWLRRKYRRKPCLIHQTKLDGITNPYGPAARVGGPIQVATPRVLEPRGV